LVVLVSNAPGRSSAFEAALYHANQGSLEHLWLVHSAGTKDDAIWIQDGLTKMHPHIRCHRVEMEDVHSIIETKDIVEHVRRRATREFDVPEKELICDFTGMTKHASAGMILACTPREARLQYMHPKGFLADGRADQSAGSYPLEVQIAFQIEEDE